MVKQNLNYMGRKNKEKINFQNTLQVELVKKSIFGKHHNEETKRKIQKKRGVGKRNS